MKTKLRVAVIPTKLNTKLPPQPTIVTEEQHQLHQLYEALYFSDYSSACNCQLLAKNKITHVINCTSGTCQNMNYEGITYHSLTLQDIAEADLIRCLDSLLPLIDSIHKCNGCVLVHCRAGCSRAPALMAGYMVSKYKEKLSTATDILRRLNCKVDINVGFLLQLEEWEKMHK